jgi:hypothetical protein
MNRIIFIGLIHLFSLSPSACQFGLQSVNGMNYYNLQLENSVIAPSNSLHYSIGPSYWFRFKNKRIEFNPALLYDYSKSDYQNSNGLSLSEHSLVFSLPVLIYPFDFSNDCNCPTFNKSGQLFEKGFHFIIYAALPYSIKKVSEPNEISLNTLGAYQLGLGAGLDFGISKKYTLSPSLVLSKTFQDTYLYNTDSKVLLEKSGDRIRVDLMIRILYYQKKKRY